MTAPIGPEMTSSLAPRRMLALWRARWGRPADGGRQVPYVDGRINRWNTRLIRASVWSRPTVPLLVPLACLLLGGALVPVRLSLDAQEAVSVFLFAVALVMRRNTGSMVTLTLAAFSLLVSLRYLCWRLSDTLAPQLDAEFLIGFALLAAEMHLAARVGLELAARLWPMVRTPLPLPARKADWPSVDVLLLCAGQTAPTVQVALDRLAFDWPRKKIRLYLVDDRHRAEIASLASPGGPTYLAPDDSPVPSAGRQPQSPASILSRAAARTDGELLMIVDCATGPAADGPDRSARVTAPTLLATAVGWFIREPALSMLSTPGYGMVLGLEPAPAPALYTLLRTPAADDACAIVRRARLIDPAGALAGGSACIGLAVPAEDSIAAAATPALLRVDHPASRMALWVKRQVEAAAALLAFCYPVSRAIFFIAPLAYLVGGVDLFRAPLEVLAACALPHLLHAHVARARMHGPQRFGMVADLRETLLSGWLLLPTAGSLLRTAWRRGAGIGVIPAALALAGCIGVAAGVWRLLQGETGADDLTAFYLAWQVLNVLLLASRLAVSEETRHLQRSVGLLRQLPAMLSLPSGHTVHCVTVDFPAIELHLRIPVPVPVGGTLGITLVHARRETAFPAQVLSAADGLLQVRIEPAARQAYLAFGASLRARGPDWPAWLAGPRADRPIAPWLSNGVIGLLIAMLDFATDSPRYLRWLHPATWLQSWKRPQ